uniref:PEP-CTERM sorting domain-containing protein n=1 Tax=candidate division CPR3 bacterium TaxID=2268181 RepID=A0A7V3N4R5_UNCC3
MKKIFLIPILFLFLSGIAWSLPFNAGDPVNINLIESVGSGFGSSGGLFKIKDLNTNITINTFCLELDEFIGSYVADVSDDLATKGGRNTDGNDKLSDATKWLYWRYTEGYSYDVKALQLAIWLLEEEYHDISDWKTWYKNNGGSEILANLALQYVSDAQGQSTTADIRVLDISYNKDGTNPAQSYLIRVPEPGGLILLGIGLTAVGLGARRFRKV